MCCLSICWKFHYFSSKIAFTFLHRQPSTPFSESTPAIVSSTILNDFGEEEKKKKKNLISKCVCWSLLACLVNQTLLSCLSVWLAGWLAGWLQRGPMRDNRRKENSHEHTQTHTYTNRHTSKFQTVADGFNSLPSFFHNLSGNLLWMTVPPFHALVRWLNAPLFCQKKGGANSTN